MTPTLKWHYTQATYETALNKAVRAHINATKAQLGPHESIIPPIPEQLTKAYPRAYAVATLTLKRYQLITPHLTRAYKAKALQDQIQTYEIHIKEPDSARRQKINHLPLDMILDLYNIPTLPNDIATI